MTYTDGSSFLRIAILAMLILGEALAWKRRRIQDEIISAQQRTIKLQNEGREADERTIKALEENIKIRQEKMGF